jgi:Ser/Thr protein kinase RdoA (MazF antagonist)
VPVSGAVEHEFAVALAELADPGPFLALSNGDPEANNVLVHADGAADARLIDFEFAGFTHALHDAVCLHVPGPAWMSVRMSALAEVYRARSGRRGAARTAQAHQALPHLAGLCRHLAEVLRTRWPDADVDLTALSPYTSRR